MNRELDKKIIEFLKNNKGLKPYDEFFFYADGGSKKIYSRFRFTEKTLQQKFYKWCGVADIRKERILKELLNGDRNVMKSAVTTVIKKR